MRRVVCFAAALALVPVTLAFAASPFDGQYKGANTLTRGAPPTCAEGRAITWSVTDGHISIKYGNVPITADVAADGSFRTNVHYQVGGKQQAEATMQGRITGANLEADVESYACKYHYALKKG
jgi:hypothetical protein